MPVFNAEHFVSNSIESILNQSYKNFEFIIIDDGSSDKTDIVLNYYRTKDSRIKVFQHGNKGLTKSLNIGIEKAQGKYIARQDADDISYKDRFKEQIFWLENYNYDLCCSRTFLK